MADLYLPATPTKLKDGSWGARVASANAREGDIVRITARNGKSWEAEVMKVIWRGKDFSICATSSIASRNIARRGPSSRTGHSAPRNGTPTGCRCGSVVEYSKPTDCWHCRHDV